MHVALLALALQVQTASLVAPPLDVTRTAEAAADSIRDARRARGAQSAFERARRAALPWESGGGGRCDVRIRRFCWWYDEESPTLAPESEKIAQRRSQLIAALDSLAMRRPGDDWLAGMRVYYRVDARRPAAADSAVRECRATQWWCLALLGYVAQTRGDARLADSVFGDALRAMPEERRCDWSDIRTLLPGDARGRYETLSCEARAPIERRYWLLAQPRLGMPNDWRTEFLSRRVLSWLAERSVSPQGMIWGDDYEELLLRYGWPTAWGRVHTSGLSTAEPQIIGHDPSPSFHFGPREELLDSLASAGDDGWETTGHQTGSRYAAIGVRRLAPVATQVARFRRGDSTLVVAAYAASDDSLRAPRAVLAAALDDGSTFSSATDSSERGVSRLLLPGVPRLAGIEIADSVAGTLARSRRLFAADTTRSASGLALSDVLLYRGGAELAATLDSALVRAIPGDTVARSRPLAVFWETYGRADTGDSLDVAITVERIDRGWLRVAGQKLGLSDEDAPLRMRWTDSRPPASDATSRSISLDLGNLPAGRYRLSLSLLPATGAPVTTSREVELLDR